MRASSARCVAPSVEAWFLVVSRESLYEQATVRHWSVRRADRRVCIGARHFDDLEQRTTHCLVRSSWSLGRDGRTLRKIFEVSDLDEVG